MYGRRSTALQLYCKATKNFPDTSNIDKIRLAMPVSTPRSKLCYMNNHAASNVERLTVLNDRYAVDVLQGLKHNGHAFK